jgi:hypothetical protein
MRSLGNNDNLAAVLPYQFSDVIKHVLPEAALAMAAGISAFKLQHATKLDQESKDSARGEPGFQTQPVVGRIIMEHLMRRRSQHVQQDIW